MRDKEMWQNLDKYCICVVSIYGLAILFFCIFETFHNKMFSQNKNIFNPSSVICTQTRHFLVGYEPAMHVNRALFTQYNHAALRMWEHPAEGMVCVLRPLRGLHPPPQTNA